MNLATFAYFIIMEFSTIFLVSDYEKFFAHFISAIFFFHTSLSFESAAWFYLQFALFYGCSQSLSLFRFLYLFYLMEI